MRRFWIICVCLLISSISLSTIIQNESLDILEQTKSNHANDSTSLVVDMKSWPLTSGDYIEATGFAEHISQDVEQAFHGTATINEDYFQIMILPDATCEIENIVDMCHVTKTTIQWNITATSQYGQITIESNSIETSLINPEFNLMSSTSTVYDQFWDIITNDDGSEDEHYIESWHNETYVKRTIGNPETITVGDTWGESVYSNGTVVFSDHSNDGHDDHGHDDHGDHDNHDDHDDHDDHGNDDDESWEEWSNLTYEVTEVVTVKLPPNMAGGNSNHTYIDVLAVETIDEEGEVQTVEAVSDYFVHKIFNFPIEEYLLAESNNLTQDDVGPAESNQNSKNGQGTADPDCDDDYILINHYEHVSYTQQQVIDGEAENWILLDPNDWPDYNHPAYYYSSTHEVLDCTEGSSIGDWSLVSDDHHPDDHDEDDCDCPDKYHQMMIQYPDNTSRVVYYRHEDLDDTRTAWDLTFQSLMEEGADLQYENTNFGHYVTGIDGVNAPSNYEWWWELYLWNETSNNWDVSDVGVDDLVLSDEDHIAWVTNNSDRSLIPTPIDDYYPADDVQFTLVSWYILNLADDDNDGIANQDDDCPNGVMGWISNPETDYDNDGCQDASEDDDDDNDGYLDTYEDSCLSDSRNTTSVPINSDNTGDCDVLDDDDDDDGYFDSLDEFPLDPSEHIDTDKDGIGNNADLDDDGDNYTDDNELDCLSNPLSASSVPQDNDNDNLCDNLDLDDDNDGFRDANDAFPFDDAEWLDTDLDGMGDNADTDDDGDDFTDEVEITCESDPKDSISIPNDTDFDELCDSQDEDDDNDEWSDIDEIACGKDPLSGTSIPLDTDKDGICDYLDTDLDGDGVENTEDTFPFDPEESTDSDGDGVGDNADAYPNNPTASIAGELDESFNLTLVLAIFTVVIIAILGTTIYLKKRNTDAESKTHSTDLTEQSEYHQFVDENGTHWLRQSDGTMYWWNGQDWTKYS